MDKIINIPEWRYNKAMENYEQLIQELEELERFRGHLGQFKKQLGGLVEQLEMMKGEYDENRENEQDGGAGSHQKTRD